MNQGSEEWASWRKAGIGASDAAVILGVSPWRTPYQLWQDKRGLLPPQEETAPMRRGKALEPVARVAYEAATGRIMQPACREYAHWPVLRASLDGLAFDGQRALEVKCPGAEDHADAVAGRVPAKYVPQCQHILLVTGAPVLDYWSFDGAEGVLVEVTPDVDFHGELYAAAVAFWQYVLAGTPPPLTARDVVVRTDAAWEEAARLYREADAVAAEWAAKKEAARLLLLGMAGGVGKVRGGGLTLTWFSKRGAVQYGRVPELQGMDLEPYRAADRLEARLTVEK